MERGCRCDRPPRLGSAAKEYLCGNRHGRVVKAPQCPCGPSSSFIGWSDHLLALGCASVAAKGFFICVQKSSLVARRQKMEGLLKEKPLTGEQPRALGQFSGGVSPHPILKDILMTAA